MKNVRDYKYVYENWYKKECKNRNEQPMLLSTFFQTVPYPEVKQLKTQLQNGLPIEPSSDYSTVLGEKELIV